MGVIQFRVERPDLLSGAPELSLIDFLMYDGRVIPARTHLANGMLYCERHLSESGQMRLLWPRFDGRRQVVHTTSLREQLAPYLLELELARGQLSRLRNQFNSWSGAGLQSSRPLATMIQDSHRFFARHGFALPALCGTAHRISPQSLRPVTRVPWLSSESDSHRFGGILSSLQRRAIRHLVEKLGTERWGV